MIYIANTNKDYENKSYVESLIKNGVDVLRFNFSYGTKEENIEKIKIAREVMKELGINVKIMADLPGGKIRLGKIPVDPLYIKKGDEVIFSDKTAKISGVPILINDIQKHLQKGDNVIYKDGELFFKVTEIHLGGFKAIAQNDYEMTSNKAMNFQHVIDSINHITEKTIEQMEVVNTVKPDFVAFSFVNSGEAIINAKKILFNHLDKGYNPTIVGKIESELGIKNIDQIVDECDWVMIARGDLALNMPFEKLGIYQKFITEKVKEKNKKVIVATQILDSLLTKHVPLRSDIIDVTNIVLDGNDAMMFSCTSESKNPGEIIKVAKNIVKQVENYRTSGVF